MREILFRGQQKDGTWLYGDLFGINYHTTNRGWCYINGVGVGKKTVGQYTGLTDKNGKKIFEGDIVKVPSFEPSVMCIAFIEGAFCLANKSGEFVADIHYIHHARDNQTEVIGNIHDTPELLEVE